MKEISSTEAKTRLNAILSEVERSGASVTITNHGRPVAVLSPAHTRPRVFGQLPAVAASESFDDPLPASELYAWDGI